MGCHCYFCRHGQSGESSKNRGVKNVRETKFNFRLPPLENDYLTGSPRGHYSQNISHRNSGRFVGHANKHRNSGSVTINGVNFDYGSYQHYKAYQRTCKLRNRTDVLNAKEDDVQKIKEPYNNVLNENENSKNSKAKDKPHDEISEFSV